ELIILHRDMDKESAREFAEEIRGYVAKSVEALYEDAISKGAQFVGGNIFKAVFTLGTAGPRAAGNGFLVMTDHNEKAKRLKEKLKK
ncbi:27883_t:CDS:2, partial [Racocetra persica]